MKQYIEQIDNLIKQHNMAIENYDRISENKIKKQKNKTPNFIFQNHTIASTLRSSVEISQSLCSAMRTCREKKKKKKKLKFNHNKPNSITQRHTKKEGGRKLIPKFSVWPPRKLQQQ